MRRTKAILIYRRTRIILAVQLLLGHNKLESTARYRGIEVDDALKIAEQTEIYDWTKKAVGRSPPGRALKGELRMVAASPWVIPGPQCW
jgi:hypothetical protein